MLKPLVDSTIEVYVRIVADLLPTPAKAHYTFNLRDVSKVFQVCVGVTSNARQLGEGRHTHGGQKREGTLHLYALLWTQGTPIP